MTGQLGVRTQDGVLVVTLDGEIDIANAGQIRVQMANAVPNTAPGLVVDLSRTTYLDSRGVHLLLEVAERLQRSQQLMRLAVPEKTPIRRVLELSHVSDAIPFDTTVAEAVENIRSALAARGRQQT